MGDSFFASILEISHAVEQRKISCEVPPEKMSLVAEVIGIKIFIMKILTT